MSDLATRILGSLHPQRKTLSRRHHLHPPKPSQSQPLHPSIRLELQQRPSIMNEEDPIEFAIKGELDLHTFHPT
jgi:hypothetical protein